MRACVWSDGARDRSRAATWIDNGTLIEQACADRSDPNQIIINFSPSNATLYIGGSLTFNVDVCLASDVSVGVALEEEGPTDDRFDVATVNTTSIPTKHISFYLHCHQQGAMASNPNYLEGHQAISVEDDNFLHVDLTGYVNGDQDDLGDNFGATQGRAHVQCLDPAVGGEARLAAPFLSDVTSGSDALLIAGIASAGFIARLALGCVTLRSRAVRH